MHTLQTAQQYSDLLGPDVESSPYEFALLFTASGWFGRMRDKNRFKLLRAIDPLLMRMLHAGERVYFVTSGTTATMAEQFFTGAAITQAINRRALVFTTERVLLLQINRRQKPGKLLSQIAYASIQAVKATWNGYCQVKLRNQTKLNFLNVPKADRKGLAALLADVIKSTDTYSLANASPGLEHLCPHCFTPVGGHPDSCPHCHGKFKRPRIALLRSFLFPGLGDLYLGHRGFAALEMMGAAWFWFLLVFSPLLGLPDDHGVVPEVNAASLTTGFVMLAVMHAIDGIMAHHFALKGHHPA